MGYVRDLLNREGLSSRLFDTMLRWGGAAGMLGTANGIGNCLEESTKNNNELFGEGFVNHISTFGIFIPPYMAALKYFASKNYGRLYANIAQTGWAVLTYLNHEFYKGTTHAVSATLISYAFGLIVTNDAVSQYRKQN